MVDPCPGNLGAARREGFMRGSAPYVGYFDPDDRAVPMLFTRMLSYMAPEYSGVHTSGMHMSLEGRPIGAPFPDLHWEYDRRLHFSHTHAVYHVRLYRRELVESYLDRLPDWPWLCDYVLGCWVARDRPLKFAPFVGRYYRIPGIASRHVTCEEKQRALQEVAQWR